MKQFLLFACLFFSLPLLAQKKPFRFAFLSDTHIGSPNGGAEEDLRRTVADINAMEDLAFVVITGDITELGKNEELQLAKRLLDSLHIPYYILPGNHDTGWSESGGLAFTETFGYDKFSFTVNGVHFLGCASGPYVRMSDGHVPRSHLNWLLKELSRIGKNEPVVFLNHYPLDNGLDNWYEIVDLLKTRNTILALCGHGHSNRPVKAEELPAVMGRSNLRAREAEGGYNLVSVAADSIRFVERRPLSKTNRPWTSVAVERHRYGQGKDFPRPDFSLNQRYPQVKPKWTYQSAANVISTPAVTTEGLVVFGNQNGLVEALDTMNGKRQWTFQTKGPIFSSPAPAYDDLVFGSADSSVYCLSASGRLRWRIATGAPVLGSPLVKDGRVYIGGSDGRFKIISLEGRQVVEEMPGLKGPVVSQPVMADGLVVFGAWDTYLYAYDLGTQSLRWKWSNGSPVINYSPAACIPVVHDGVVYVVAPDRYLTAIDLQSGKTLWRTNQATVRESLGLSADGQLVYGKTMQDTLVAFRTNREKPELAWKLPVGYGYEHAPSMLVEKEGRLFFGTRNGVVYCIDPAAQRVVWAHKIDNSMVNTVNVLSRNRVLAATMDGKVCLLASEE